MMMIVYWLSILLSAKLIQMGLNIAQFLKDYLND